MTEDQNKAEEGPMIRSEQIDHDLWCAWVVGQPGMIAFGDTETEAREELDVSIRVVKLYEGGKFKLP